MSARAERLTARVADVLDGSVSWDFQADMRLYRFRWTPVGSNRSYLTSVSQEMMSDNGIDIESMIGEALLHARRSDTDRHSTGTRVFGEDIGHSDSIGYGATVYNRNGEPIGRIRQVSMEMTNESTYSIRDRNDRIYVPTSMSITLQIDANPEDIANLFMNDGVRREERSSYAVMIPNASDLQASYVSESDPLPVSQISTVEFVVDAETRNTDDHEEDDCEPYSIADFVEDWGTV